MILFSILLLFFVGRSLIDSIFHRIEANKVVHADNTKMVTGVESQVKGEIAFVLKNEDGELKRYVADMDSLSGFAKINIPILEAARKKAKDLVGDSVETNNNKSFIKIHNRVPVYADWYFSYTTTYKILYESGRSGSSHLFEPRVTSLRDEVALDIQKYLEKHFDEIVFKPEITDQELKHSYQTSLSTAHHDYLKAVANLEDEFQKFIEKKTTHLKPVRKEAASSSEIDWNKQLNKISMAGYEKGKLGPAIGGGIMIGGALFGKALAGKVLASGLGKAFFAKLSAPFIAKAITIAGGAIGAAVAGPVGAFVGLVGGFIGDFGITKGVELANRPTFEKDSNEVISSFETELNEHETKAIQEAVDVWFQDTMKLLKQFEN